MNPESLSYSKSHEWVHLENSEATIGISEFAVKELTDLVYVDLPQPGKTLNAGEVFGEVESVKAVSDLYAPISGTVKESNEDLENHLEWLNDDAYGQGWLIKIQVDDTDQVQALMDYAAYQEFCANEQDSH